MSSTYHTCGLLRSHVLHIADGQHTLRSWTADGSGAKSRLETLLQGPFIHSVPTCTPLLTLP